MRDQGKQMNRKQIKLFSNTPVIPSAVVRVNSTTTGLTASTCSKYYSNELPAVLRT